jgi:hypothetical protein
MQTYRARCALEHVSYCKCWHQFMKSIGQLARILYIHTSTDTKRCMHLFSTSIQGWVMNYSIWLNTSSVLVYWLYSTLLYTRSQQTGYRYTKMKVGIFLKIIWLYILVFQFISEHDRSLLISFLWYHRKCANHFHESLAWRCRKASYSST